MLNKSYKTLSSLAVATMLGGLMAQPAQAAAERQATVDGSGSEIGDIVVTARKRAETVQSVPLSVTAVDAAMIARNNITNISDVTIHTPNVTINPISISTTSAAPYIRGIGASSQEPTQDQPIAIAIDGVYSSSVAGSLLDVFDAAQVEVLRGPQGALQGRNSPGGAILVTTRRPTDDVHARLEAMYGNYNAVQIKMSMDGPIVEGKIGVKAALLYRRHDGFVKNTITGRRLSASDTLSARVGVLLRPAETINWYLTADYTNDESGQVGLRFFGASPDDPAPITACADNPAYCTPAPRRTSLANYDKASTMRGFGLSSNLDIDFGSMTLTSVTGYRQNREFQNVDIDALPTSYFAIFDRDYQPKQFSQELRLASSGKDGGAGTFDWIVGGYYLNSKFSIIEPQQIFGTVFTKERGQTLNSYAIFGQGTFHISDTLSVSGGGRQSWDKKQVRAKFIGDTVFTNYKASFSNLSLEAGIEYKPSRDFLAYARFSQGYRSGGINGAVNSADTVRAYKPEKLNAYEVGIKSEFLDRTVRLNLTGFYYDYKEIQRVVTETAPGGRVFDRITNQGKARMLGIEGELAFKPNRNFNVSAIFGYLDAKNLDPAFRNLRIPYTPKFSGTLSADATLPLGEDNGLTLSGDVNYRSKQNVNASDLRVGDQKAYALVNASLTYFIASKYRFTLFADNLTNSYYITNAEWIGLSRFTLEGAPRTYGLRVSADF